MKTKSTATSVKLSVNTIAIKLMFMVKKNFCLTSSNRHACFFSKLITFSLKLSCQLVFNYTCLIFFYDELKAHT